MKAGIRSKVVLLLAAVALLPLLAALVSLVVVGSRRQIESVGSGMQLAAAAGAEALSVSMTKDVEKLLQLIRHPKVPELLNARDTALSQAERDRLDRIWPTLSLDEGPMSQVLSGSVAYKLQVMAKWDPDFTEILLTDRFGQLVAASGRTSDFYQADEDWWQGAYNDGTGSVYVPPVRYDRSSNIWSLNLCVPILLKSKVIGICKAVVDVSTWIETVHPVDQMGTMEMLVRPDGMIIHRHGTEPLTERASEWVDLVTDPDGRGWRITADGEIQGYVPVKLPDRIEGYEVSSPTWALVLYRPKGDVLRPIYMTSLAILGVGLIVIVAIFLIGVWLVDRSVVRRIRSLAQATRQVAAGDLDSRVTAGGGRRLLGSDEINELADDFNSMVQHVQRSYDRLTAANELKSNFIRIASHELRTPIAYMLGLAKLLRDNRDPQRLASALTMMGLKAKRLSEIIQAMFKVMPGQLHADEMVYSDVDLAELLEEIRVDVSPFLEERRQRVIVEPGQSAPIIQADREKLRDVIESLVMNAIKFTPDGGVIKVRIGKQLGGFVSLSVQDQGPGIPQRDLPHIFEPFFTGGDVMLHSTGTSGFEKRGMGLGLAVVKHFVNMHAGTVSVRSGPQGTTFVVSVPAEAQPRSKRPAAPRS